MISFFLFNENTNICNFAADNTIYSYNNNLQTILKNLKHDIDKCFEML